MATGSGESDTTPTGIGGTSGGDKAARMAGAAVGRVGGEPKTEKGQAARSAVSSAASGAVKGAKGGVQGAVAGAATGAAKDLAVRKLAVGGASLADKPNNNGDSPVPGSDTGSPVGKTAAAVAAVPAAGGAGQAMFMMMLMNWMKTMFMAAMAAMAAMANMATAIFGAALALAQSAVAGLMAIGASISAAVGGVISAGVAAISVATAGVAIVGMVAGLIVTGQAFDSVRRDGVLADCSTNVMLASQNADLPDPASDSAQVQANARLIYSVLSAWGMPDENIAGILGNWAAESGIDPSRVQNSPNTPYSVSPDEQAAAENTDNGIGLGQWTFGRNQALRDYAADKGSSWGTIDIQLGFMISAAEGANADIVQEMISESKGSPAAAAVFFHDEWERSADTSMDKRKAGAESWFAQMGGWEANHALANSIRTQAGVTLSGANVSALRTAQDECLTAGVGAVSLQEGGLSLEEAELFMEHYKVVGEAKLAAAFGAGGPGTCSGGKADNCVGFSAYFTHEFTSFKQFAPGNGIDTAASIAEMNNLPLTRIPTVYSVFSKVTNDVYGHTGVILGIEGDNVIIGEAVCDSNHTKTRAYTLPLTDVLNNPDWEFVDVSSLIVNTELSS